MNPFCFSSLAAVPKEIRSYDDGGIANKHSQLLMFYKHNVQSTMSFSPKYASFLNVKNWPTLLTKLNKS